MAAGTPIAALIVRVLTDTAELVTGMKQATGSLDSLESRVAGFGKAISGYFTAQAVINFATDILQEAERIEVGAKRVGASSEEFQRFSFALKQSGGDAEQAAAAIVALNQKIGSGDEGLNGVLRKLNFNLDEFRAKDPTSRYIELGAAISRINDPAEQAALRFEALGSKGESALSKIDAEFAGLAERAPTYSAETTKALEEIGDWLDELATKAKVAAAEIVVAVAKAATAAPNGTSDPGSYANAKAGMGDNYKQYLNGPDVDPSKFLPSAPTKDLPAKLGTAGVDPNDIKALAVVIADLNVQLSVEVARVQEAKEQWDSKMWILKTIIADTPKVGDAIETLMSKMGSTENAQRFATMITDAAISLAKLRQENDKIAERISGQAKPGSGRPEIDRLEGELANVRKDPQNFDETGNLTPLALEREYALLDQINLKTAEIEMGLKGMTDAAGNHLGMIQQVGDAYSKLRQPSTSLSTEKQDEISKAAAEHRYYGPVTANGTPDFSRIAGAVGPTSIQINAQGLWDDPSAADRLGRIVDEALTRRASERGRL